jgi:MFS family permease
LIILFLAASAEAKNIIKIGSDVTIGRDQEVNNVIAIGAQITINGLVDHNAVAIGGSIVLTSDAVVRGNVICIGGIVVRGSESQVFGNITEINSSNITGALNSAFNSEWDGWSWLFALVSICIFLAIMVIALLITLLLPKPIKAISAAIRINKGKSFFWGFLGILLIGPLAVLLAISIIGIPLIPLEFAVVVIAIIIGFIAVSTISGNYVLVTIFKKSEPSLIKSTMLGLLLLWLIGWIPYIGWIIKTLAAILGMGGVFVAVFDRRQPIAPSPSMPEAPVDENSSFA